MWYCFIQLYMFLCYAMRGIVGEVQLASMAYIVISYYVILFTKLWVY